MTLNELVQTQAVTVLMLLSSSAHKTCCLLWLITAMTNFDVSQGKDLLSADKGFGSPHLHNAPQLNSLVETQFAFTLGSMTFWP